METFERKEDYSDFDEYQGSFFNKSREDLKKDVLTSLGHPIIRVSLTDDHLNNSINWALKMCWRWHPDFTETRYYMYRLTEEDHKTKSFKLPDYVDAVGEIIPRTFDNLGIMAFTTASFQMNQQMFMEYNRFSNISLLDFVSIEQRLYNTGNILGQNIRRFDYSRLSRTVNVYFETKPNELIILKVYEQVNPDRRDDQARDYSYVWDNEQLKALAIASAKQTWGRMLTKYQGVHLPGGITMNGDQILREANDDLEEAIRFLKNQNPYGAIYMA
jgi:hypothetical protein